LKAELKKKECWNSFETKTNTLKQLVKKIVVDLTVLGKLCCRLLGFWPILPRPFSTSKLRTTNFFLKRSK
jgi:hypothetical protein